MREKLRFLGLDVHAETIAVAVAEPNGEVRSLGTIANREDSIRKFIKRLDSPERLRAGTFGWSMQVENCCTSYPISVAVAVMRDGKTTVLRSDQMVWRWHFIDHGNRIAVLSGPVHGDATEADLYDVNTGKNLATWLGSGNAPAWTDGWEDQFASDAN